MSEETKANQTEEAVSKEHESQEKYWYVVHTQTGHEDKVKEKILTQIKVQNFGDRVFNVLVPTEEVVEVKQNKKTLRKRKFFPGYILVEMILTSQTYWFIRNIIGVTGFLGDPYPVPLPEEEIAARLKDFTPLNKPLSGYLKRYAAAVTGGASGAVLM